jgi:hypothetical protein
MLYYLGFTVAMGLVYNRIDANNKLKDYIFKMIFVGLACACLTSFLPDLAVGLIFLLLLFSV